MTTEKKQKKEKKAKVAKAKKNERDYVKIADLHYPLIVIKIKPYMLERLGLTDQNTRKELHEAILDRAKLLPPEPKNDKN